MSEGVKRYGLTELYSPSDKKERVAAEYKISQILLRNTAKYSYLRSVIFVHGLFGHPYETWTAKSASSESGGQLRDQVAPARSRLASLVPRFGHRERSVNERSRTQSPASHTASRSPSPEADRDNNSLANHQVFWPKDLLPKAIPNIRVFTFGYDVDIYHFNPFTGAAGQASIYQHAKTLLGDIANARMSEEETKRPVIFVVHSLGGIVVKDALGQSRAERTHLSQILPATAGVCFLGTPHRGSGTASLGKIAAEFSKATLKNPNSQILRTLEVNSSELERIGTQFAQILVDRRIKVHSFYEEYPTKGIMVVQNFSYSIGDGLETTSAIPANHSNMTKVSNPKDEGFGRIVNLLKRWIATEGGGIDALRPNPYPSESLILPKAKDRCMNSLNFSETRSRLAEVQKAFGNTYEWIFQDGVSFKEWLSSHAMSSMFWIKGKPGSGKSTLMKFVLQHPLTIDYLPNFDLDRWVIAGFFFHDRGSGVQKSILGLLCAVLYKILLQETDMMQFVLPIFLRSKASSIASSGESSQTGWEVEELASAFLAILQQKKVKLNLCLFIDALDEHEGDHLVLLQLLKNISSQNRESAVRLKLCLASREENVFQNGLGDLPGLIIHEHTFNDIQVYASGRLAMEPPRSVARDDFHSLQTLSVKITKKSRGVFIWVKLVVDEMIIDLNEEGSSIQVSDLHDILLAIPEELKGLYERALSRLVKRLDRLTATKTRRETFIMFQIALCTRSPIPLAYFINAASLLATGKPIHLELTGNRQPNATPEMVLRLNSRCGGLLEPVTGQQYDSSNNRETVQFIHQTAKEFMIEKMAKPRLVENMFQTEYENGHLLLMRYCIMVARLEMDIRIPDFAYHAVLAERTMEKSNAVELDQLLEEGSADPLRGLEEFCLYFDVDKSFGHLRVETKNPHVWMLLIAIYAGLFLYFKEKLSHRIWSKKGYLNALLSGAIRAMLTQEELFLDPRFVELLLAKGASPDTRFEERTPLQWLGNTSDFYQPDCLFWKPQAVRVVSLLLEHGADANQPISDDTGPLLSQIARALKGFKSHGTTTDKRITYLGSESNVRTRELNICKIVETLLKFGASVDPPDPHDAPLPHAVKARHKSVARILLQHGAKLPSLEDLSLILMEDEVREWEQIFEEYYVPQPRAFTTLLSRAVEELLPSVHHMFKAFAAPASRPGAAER